MYILYYCCVINFWLMGMRSNKIKLNVLYFFLMKNCFTQDSLALQYSAKNIENMCKNQLSKASASIPNCL